MEKNTVFQINPDFFFLMILIVEKYLLFMQLRRSIESLIL